MVIQERVTYLNGRRHELFDVRLFLVLVYEPPPVTHANRDTWRSPARAIRQWLSPHEVLRILGDDLERALATLHHKAQAFQVQLSDVGLERLAKTEAFRFLRELVNCDEAVIDAAKLRYDTHVDYFASDSAVECHRADGALSSHHEHTLVITRGAPLVLTAS